MSSMTDDSGLKMAAKPLGAMSSSWTGVGPRDVVDELLPAFAEPFAVRTLQFLLRTDQSELHGFHARRLVAVSVNAKRVVALEPQGAVRARRRRVHPLPVPAEVEGEGKLGAAVRALELLVALVEEDVPLERILPVEGPRANRANVDAVLLALPVLVDQRKLARLFPPFGEVR